MTSVKFNGREVTGFMRPVVAFLVITGGVLAVFGVALMLIILAGLSPVLIPFHYALRAAGRKGFTEDNGDGGYKIEVGPAGFRKA